MLPNITIPLDSLPQEREGPEDVLFAFSVHGLGGASKTSAAASSSRWGVMPSEASPPPQLKDAPKKGWLSSFNTAVVGDRPETITLMLTLSASKGPPSAAAPAATPASSTPGIPGMPPLPSMARQSTGERLPSTILTRSMSTGRQNTPMALLYQSEHRQFGQQAPTPATRMSTSPSAFPGVGGEAGEGLGGGQQRPITMSEEGIVHFSVPARISGKFALAGGVAPDTGQDKGVVFSVELWHVVNRSRRVPLGSLLLSWEDLIATPDNPRKCGVFSGLESERYPSAFLVARRIASPLPRPLSLSPRGSANPSLDEFNPMVTFFTAIRRSSPDSGAGVGDRADWSRINSLSETGERDGSGVFGAASSSAAEGWELVVCQELAVEGKFTFKLPLLFLSPVHNSLKHAASAWQVRARRERERQGLFELDEEAFASGMVLVRVSVRSSGGIRPAATAVWAVMSSSMRKFGGRMKGMGVKAVAMARIASQASPTAHLRLGAVSVQEKILRQANFFVKVVYEPPAGSGSASASGDDADRVVGVTNTEYGSVEPVWGTNANRGACPYNAPRLQHQVSGATRLDVVTDITAGERNAFFWLGATGVPSEEGQGEPLSSLAFTFYVPAKHVEEGGGGRLHLHLCQNMFSLKAGIVDAPVGCVTVPLSKNAPSSVRKPEWRDVEGYHDAPSAFPATGGGVGDLLPQEYQQQQQQQQQQGRPQVLVGVSVKAREASFSRPGSPRRGAPLPLNDDASSALGSDGPAAYGSTLGSGGGGDGSKGDAGAGAARNSLGSGEWTKVEEDSDSDEEVAPEGAAAAAAAASTTSMHRRVSGSSENLLSKTVTIHDCYRWMELIKEPSRVLDKDALVDLYALVDYPLSWVESHARGVSDQADRLATVLDVYAQRLSEGANFRSSLLKKEPLLQYVATNLHIQVWSIRDPVTGRDRSYDFVTTGAPTAHALGHAGGGLVTLQAKLQAVGVKVMGLKATRRECRDGGGVQAVTDLEGHTDNLRAALLEFEALSGKVSLRRACVISQAISIAATSFCAKLEMMARGTLDVESDRAAGGCGSYDELAERWTTRGFLLGFEGLLSIHGKEHGMVEDTVAALDMLADYNLKVVPGSPVESSNWGSDITTGGGGGDEDDDFELEVGVEGKTIQCIVGDGSLARLPRALWGNSGGGGASGGNGGGRTVRIVPVLFTQGIDIQQSMSHAARDAREKAAFQADINSQNLARLNRYCHRVSPVHPPPGSAAANPHPAGAADAFQGWNQGAGGATFPAVAASMPSLPRPTTGGAGGNVDDLLGLGDLGISAAGPEGGG
ncbi:unnamed protein product, partial [Scytosiphon promiscuus]